MAVTLSSLTRLSTSFIRCRTKNLDPFGRIFRTFCRLSPETTKNVGFIKWFLPFQQVRLFVEGPEILSSGLGPGSLYAPATPAYQRSLGPKRCLASRKDDQRIDIGPRNCSRVINVSGGFIEVVRQRCRNILSWNAGTAYMLKGATKTKCPMRRDWTSIGTKYRG